MGKLGSTDMKLVLLYMWGTRLLWGSFLLYVYSLFRFLLFEWEPLSLGVWECEVQFSQCEGQLSQFYLQVLLLLVVLLSVLDLLCVLSGQFCFGNCPNWQSRRSVHLVSLPSRFSGILCLAFFVSHPGSSALVTVWIGDQGDRFSWFPSLRSVYN